MNKKTKTTTYNKADNVGLFIVEVVQNSDCGMGWAEERGALEVLSDLVSI